MFPNAPQMLTPLVILTSGAFLYTNHEIKITSDDCLSTHVDAGTGYEIFYMIKTVLFFKLLCRAEI